MSKILKEHRQNDDILEKSYTMDLFTKMSTPKIGSQKDVRILFNQSIKWETILLTETSLNSQKHKLI